MGSQKVTISTILLTPFVLNLSQLKNNWHAGHRGTEDTGTEVWQLMEHSIKLY